nr:6-hydroxymethylpterin diphosphokinase MptE-like protein [Entomospira nematocera]
MLQVVGKAWVRNTIKNMREKISVLSQFPKLEKPVIIIGAGLTLDKYITWLGDLQKYYYIIAVDTALPTLQQYNIIPDIVLVLESSPVNLLDFSEGIHSDTTLIYDITAHPQTKRIHDGSSVSIMSDFSRDPFYQRLKEDLQLLTIPEVGSVGVAAISIALRMTTAEIILCGLDFAYLPGKSHARGSYVHTLQLQEWSRLTGIPKSLDLFSSRESFRIGGQGGQLLWSDDVLASYGSAIMKSDSKRIYTLSSPYSMDLALPIWEIVRDAEYQNSVKKPIYWDVHQISEEKWKILQIREQKYLEQNILFQNRECMSYLYLGYGNNDISANEYQQRAEQVYSLWGLEQTE